MDKEKGRKGATYTRKMTLVGAMAPEALRGACGHSGEGIQGSEIITSARPVL